MTRTRRIELFLFLPQEHTVLRLLKMHILATSTQNTCNLYWTVCNTRMTQKSPVWAYLNQMLSICFNILWIHLHNIIIYFLCSFFFKSADEWYCVEIQLFCIIRNLQFWRQNWSVIITNWLQNVVYLIRNSLLISFGYCFYVIQLLHTWFVLARYSL